MRRTAYLSGGRRSGLLLVCVLLVPSPLIGMGVSDARFAGDTIEVASNPIEAASLAFASALEAASNDGLTGIMVAEGIRLQLNGSSHSGLSARQAVATLRDFLREYEDGSAAVTRAAPVQGTPMRGFAEIEYSARVTGTSQEVRQALFVGLSNNSGDWRVDEVRFIR